MRKFTSLALYSFLLSTAHATHAPFSGVSLMTGLGGIDLEVDATQQPSADVTGFINPALPANSQLSQINFMGEIGLSYAYQFNSGVFLGILLTAGFTPAEVENTQDFQTSQSTLILLTSTLETQLKNDFSLLFKPGYVLGNTLFYGLIGPRWGNFESTLVSDFSLETPPNPKGTANGSDTVSSYELGLTAGLGIQQLITDQFSLGLEYMYTRYNDLSAPEVSTGIYVGSTQFGTLTDIPTLDAFTNTVMVTLSYRL